MLAIQNASSDKTVVPNVLPCAIRHNGPVSAAERYWKPSVAEDGTSTSFFRGRKLRGRKVALPKGYEGKVLEKTDRKVVGKPDVPIPGAEDGLDEAVAPKEVDTFAVDQKSRFDEIMVWDHEAQPDNEDVYVKGIEEWIGFAEAVGSVRLFQNSATLVANFPFPPQMHSYVPADQKDPS